jgi:hypothetical protein
LPTSRSIAWLHDDRPGAWPFLGEVYARAIVRNGTLTFKAFIRAVRSVLKLAPMDLRIEDRVLRSSPDFDRRFSRQIRVSVPRKPADVLDADGIKSVPDLGPVPSSSGRPIGKRDIDPFWRWVQLIAATHSENFSAGVW